MTNSSATASLIGQVVTGNLGRDDTDFVGVVTEEYLVEVGPFTGMPMVKVDTTDGRTICAIKGLLTVVTVVPSVFPRMHNIIDANHHIGHVQECESGFMAFRAIEDGDLDLGVCPEFTDAVALVVASTVS